MNSTTPPTTTDTAADPTTRAPATGRRALVLGGGGSTGNAWLIGVVAGLYASGLDVTTADLTIGTSAGSTAAAQLAGATPDELYAAVLAAAPPPQAVPDRVRAPADAVAAHLERMQQLIAAAADPTDLRRRIGAAALERAATGDDSWQPQWRATVAARLPDPHWPQRAMIVTAVDAATGEPVLFDRASGVELVDAVATSCSSGPAYRIGDRHYVDGGYRANAENADLAAGYARVLVLSPFGGRTLTPAAWGLDLATQVDGLRASGSHVETIAPAGDAEHLFGPHAMDPTLRPAAARAGHDQGRAVARSLTRFWQ